MKIYLFHAAAGHGHQKVAEVLEETFHEKNTSLEIHFEDALDSTHAVWKNSYPASYFLCVKYAPFVWGFFYELLDIPWVYNLVSWIRRGVNYLFGRKLLARMIQENPDVIICTHFFSAELFATAKRKGKLNSKLITVITDFFPHSFWLNPGTDAYWVMNESSQRACERRGVDSAEVIPGGIPVDAAFLPTKNRDEILQKYEMQSERFTLLLSSGSFGLGPYAEILKELEEFKDKIQCFVVCGNNAHMKEELEKHTYDYPVRVFGFVDFMSDLMEASDLMLAKSGGATTVESLAKKLPMAVLKPIPGQETRNAKFLVEHEASYPLNRPHDVVAIVRNILNDENAFNRKKAMIESIAKPNAASDLVDYVLRGE